MVLMNASKKVRHTSSIVNRNQGGGDKKAGFPYQVGKSSWTSVAFDSINPVGGKCCKLSSYQNVMFPLAHQSRPIGRNYNGRYWHIPGTN